MTAPWQSRMQWELKQLSNNPPPGVVVWPVDGSSLAHLEAQVEGPRETVYEGGVFRLDVQIPDRYPHEPPKVRFITQVYHPNITPTSGLICLSTLNLRPKGDWTPATNLGTLMTTIRVLLSAPNPDDGLVTDITDQYKQNRAAFDATAREWTARYAKPGLLGPSDDAQRPQTDAAPVSAPQPAPAAQSVEAAPAARPQAGPAQNASSPDPAERAQGGAAAAVAPCALLSQHRSDSPPPAAAAASPPAPAFVDGAGARSPQGAVGGAEGAENVPPIASTAGAPAAGAKRPEPSGAEPGAQAEQPPAARKRRMQLARPQPAAPAAAPAAPAEGQEQGGQDWWNIGQ